jgi:hypothetical protein
MKKERKKERKRKKEDRKRKLTVWEAFICNRNPVGVKQEFLILS